MKAQQILVGAHPWVYAATQPGYDPYPVLDEIFADMSYAGLDGVELMHTVFRAEDAVARIGELSQRYALPVIGTSFGGAMWDRAAHPEVFEYAEKVVTRLARLDGKTLGVSCHAPTEDPRAARRPGGDPDPDDRPVRGKWRHAQPAQPRLRGEGRPA